MSAQPAASGGKVCVVCGTDVSRKPRVKDTEGRYMCEGMCEQAARERAKAAAAKAAAPRLTSAAKPASSRPGASPPPANDDYDMMSDLLSDSPAVSATACPGCGNVLSGGALVCMNCGYNARVGKAAKTNIVKMPKASQMPVPRRRSSGEFGPSFGVLFLLIVGPLSALCLLGTVSPMFWALGLLAAVGVYLVGIVWGIVSAFREGETGWGVCGILSFIVPFVGLFFLYYMLVPNSDKWSKALFTGGLVSFIVGIFVLYAVLGGPEGLELLAVP